MGDRGRRGNSSRQRPGRSSYSPANVRPEALTFHHLQGRRWLGTAAAEPGTQKVPTFAPDLFLVGAVAWVLIVRETSEARVQYYLINAISLSSLCFSSCLTILQDTLPSYQPRSYRHISSSPSTQKDCFLFTTTLQETIKNIPPYHTPPNTNKTAPSTKTTAKMTDAMPLPTQRSSIPRNDSFSAEDLTKALKASATKKSSTNLFSQDHSAVPPPSPHQSRPVSRRSSFYGSRR